MTDGVTRGVCKLKCVTLTGQWCALAGEGGFWWVWGWSSPPLFPHTDSARDKPGPGNTRCWDDCGSPPHLTNTTDTNRETDIQTAYSTSRSWLNLTKSVNHTSRSPKKKEKKKEMYLHKNEAFCTVTSFSGQLSTSTLKWNEIKYNNKWYV